MSITLYGLAACDTCRKARRWLDDLGVEYRNHDVRADGMSPVAIADLADLAGWEPLVNRRSTTWRSLSEGDRDGLDKQRAIALIARHPTLMKRPVLVSGDRAVVGFDIDTWAGLLR